MGISIALSAIAGQHGRRRRRGINGHPVTRLAIAGNICISDEKTALYQPARRKAMTSSEAWQDRTHGRRE